MITPALRKSVMNFLFKIVPKILLAFSNSHHFELSLNKSSFHLMMRYGAVLILLAILFISLNILAMNPEDSDMFMGEKCGNFL